MAYWIYCQTCKQWNKSAVPLSYDMSCSFCNNLFINAKQQYINSNSGDGTIEELIDSQNSSTIPEITEKHEESDFSDPGEALINPDTSEILETPAAIETSEISEAFEKDEIPEETEISTTPDMFKDPEIPAVIETSEIPEAFESQEIQQEDSETPVITEISEKKDIPAHRLFMLNKKRSRKSR